MEPRLKRLNKLFINYSQGNFDYKVNPSPCLDEIDALISNINMLGEELKATTISKNYFNNIFNSVSDVLFIMSKNGDIRDLNNAGHTLLKASSENKMGTLNLFNLFVNTHEEKFFKKQLKKLHTTINTSAKLRDTNGKIFECLISVNKIGDERTGLSGYQGIIKDISKEKEREKLVIRTIVDTQEKERNRFARDLHDSLGQQLSGISFFIEALKKTNNSSSRSQLELLTKSGNAVHYAIRELRNICFNLMPRTLKDFGVINAIKELCKKIELKGELKFHISGGSHLPPLKKALEIAIFRIVQEFINNTIKHGNGKNIGIKIKNDLSNLYIHLEDDGIGFDVTKLGKFEGMGLQNVQSRISSYDGEVEIKSTVGVGTSYTIKLPIKYIRHEQN